jgi:sulfatase maturation enzyme AslB (radical SAM superfamily)
MAARAHIVRGVVQAWGRKLTGHRPNLSIEITRECPLRCPGCYAYGEAHLGGDVTLRGLADYRGDEVIQRFVEVIDSRRPLHVSIVGGEPLIRYRELNAILTRRAARNIHTQLVTSAVRPIPPAWACLRRLQVVVSVDGLPAGHDQRRAPATYERILKHIAGHQVTIHCTATRQQVRRTGYLEESCDSGKQTSIRA